MPEPALTFRQAGRLLTWMFFAALALTLTYCTVQELPDRIVRKDHEIIIISR